MTGITTGSQEELLERKNSMGRSMSFSVARSLTAERVHSVTESKNSHISVEAKNHRMLQLSS